MVAARTIAIIEKPVAEVFSFVTNPDNLPIWVRGDTPEKLSPGPFGEGTLLGHSNRLFATFVVKVVNYRVDEGFQTKSLRAPLSIGIEGELVFVAISAGTRLTLSHRIMLPWWLRPLAPLLARQAQRGSDEAVQALKNAVEQGVGHAAFCEPAIQPPAR